MAAALASGADRVLVVGSTSAASAERLKLAREMGALTETSDEGTSERITGALGQVDAVIDTVGHPSTMASAVRMLGRSGVLVIAGLSGGDASLDTAAIVRNLITVKGVRGRSPQAMTERSNFSRAAGLVSTACLRTACPSNIGATLRAMKERTRAGDPPHRDRPVVASRVELRTIDRECEVNPFRRSYEARVLVVPLGSGGTRVVEDLGAAGVEGVRCTDRS